eukprot:7710816-Pyramimonas_sp.AAC.1
MRSTGGSSLVPASSYTSVNRSRLFRFLSSCRETRVREQHWAVNDHRTPSNNMEQHGTTWNNMKQHGATWNNMEHQRDEIDTAPRGHCRFNR